MSWLIIINFTNIKLLYHLLNIKYNNKKFDEFF